MHSSRPCNGRRAQGKQVNAQKLPREGQTWKRRCLRHRGYGWHVTPHRVLRSNRRLLISKGSADPLPRVCGYSTRPTWVLLLNWSSA